MTQEKMIREFNTEFERLRKFYIYNTDKGKSYFYGFIRCLEIFGMNEENIKILRIKILETFK